MMIPLEQLKHQEGFTLIELLIVIGVLAILTTVAVLVLNPLEFLKQTRDSIRLADLKTINAALTIYLSQSLASPSLGALNTVYVSVPDASPTCANLGLPPLSVPWSYGCAPTSTYRNVDGTGWVPVNLTNIPPHAPLSVLPIDPINTTSSGLYYTYVTGASWELNATLESQRYGQGGQRDRVTKDGGDSSSRYEIGSNLTLSPLNDGAAVGSWWNTNWLNRRRITLSGATSTAQLTNFPIAVLLNSSRIDYSKTQNSGQDIRFVDSDDATALNYEIEKWDESATSTLWVKVPTIATSTTDYIWMYYNNTGASDNSTTTGVWDSNFAGVWHHHNASNASSTDSTSNDNDGAMVDGVTATTTGQLDGALDFDGVNDYVVSDSGAPLEMGLSDWTISAWIKTSQTAGAQIVSKTGFGCCGSFIDDGYNLEINNGYLLTRLSVESTIYLGSTQDGTQINNNSWHHVVGVWDRDGSMIRYVDGAQTGTATGISPYYNTDITDTAHRLTFGERPPGIQDINYDGVIDDVRISRVARSAAWIEAEYKNGADTYNSYGNEESAP